jgi:hypothetical protein
MSNQTHVQKKNRQKKNRHRSRNKRNTDEDQYVTLGTKIMMLIIKIVRSCKPKKRVI